MAEWRLFPEGTVPEFTTTEFFQRHPWIAPVHQFGHEQRTKMVADLVVDLVTRVPTAGIVDLGCGDGSLLSQIAGLAIPMWGYDAGVGNVERAATLGIDVRHANILDDHLEYGDLVIATEVVEHLVDPHRFVATIPGHRLVLSSPSAETGDWHYEHHAWAWDVDGYRRLVEDAGWTVIDHRECEAPAACHGGVWRPQRFQAIAATR